MAQRLPPVLIQRLGGDHVRIAGVVREVAELIDTTAKEPDWQRLSEVIEFLSFYADRVHHPLEDRLFDRLVNKGLTPTERRLVFKNLRQHQEITALTEAMSEQIVRALKGGVIDADDFRETAAGYVSLQHRHMRFEEAYLFPLLEAEFDDQDWNALTGILRELQPAPEESHE